MHIYGLLDPETKELRYIGFSSQPLDKRLSKHISEARRNLFHRHKDNWIRSLLAKGLKPEIFAIQETSQIDWMKDESQNIEYFKAIGCNLTNLTSGGEGTLNPSESTRNKIRELRNNESEATREKRRLSLIGHCVSDETRAKIAKSKIGKIPSGETKDKMSKARAGRKMPESVKLKISKTKKGKKSRLPAWNKGLNKNTSSSVAKYAQSKIGKKRNSELMRSIGIKNRKVSEKQIVEIRQKFREDKIRQASLARMYGVSSALICLIVNGKVR